MRAGLTARANDSSRATDSGFLRLVVESEIVAASDGVFGDGQLFALAVGRGRSARLVEDEGLDAPDLGLGQEVVEAGHAGGLEQAFEQDAREERVGRFVRVAEVRDAGASADGARSVACAAVLLVAEGPEAALCRGRLEEKVGSRTGPSGERPGRISASPPSFQASTRSAAGRASRAASPPDIAKEAPQPAATATYCSPSIR